MNSRPDIPISRGAEISLLHPLFAWVWALNLLLYYVRVPVDDPFHLVLFLPIVWVLVLPRSPRALVAFAAAHLAVYYRESPVDSNYLTVTAVLNLAILLCAIAAALDRKREPFSLATILPRLRPLIILVISATYLFSVFHKLNDSFLDAGTSEAVRILSEMREDDYPVFLAWVPEMVPGGVAGNLIAIWGTLAVETLVPVLLLVPRWRFAGIVLDFIFHFVMGYRVYPASTNFPCLLSASMMLLFPVHASAFLRREYAWVGRLRPVAWALRHRVVLLVLSALVLAPFFFRIPGIPEGFHAVREFCRGNFWNLYVVVYAVTLWRYYRETRTRGDGVPLAEPASAFALRPRVLWVLPLFFSLQCLAPHLGLKTRASAEVYSGLLTFEGKTNHLLIPSSWQIFPHTRETVTIVGPSNSSYLTSLGEARAVMPHLHFVRLAIRNRKRSAEFLYRGEIHRVERLGDLPDVIDPPYHPLELRFLPMHHVPEAEMERLRETGR